MESAGAYGAGKAGSFNFDPVAFFTHPRTILRLMSWVSLLCNVRVGINGQAYLHSPPNPSLSLCLSPIHIVPLSLFSNVTFMRININQCFLIKPLRVKSLLGYSFQHRNHFSDAASGWSSNTSV